MDNDLMDRWAACVFGVDCETHRAVLEELQQLRNELTHELETGLCEEEAADLRAECLTFQNERDAIQEKLEAERARSADLLRRIEAIVDFAQERAA